MPVKGYIWWGILIKFCNDCCSGRVVELLLKKLSRLHISFLFCVHSRTIMNTQKIIIWEVIISVYHGIQHLENMLHLVDTVRVDCTNQMNPSFWEEVGNPLIHFNTLNRTPAVDYQTCLPTAVMTKQALNV